MFSKKILFTAFHVQYDKGIDIHKACFYSEKTVFLCGKRYFIKR